MTIEEVQDSIIRDFKDKDWMQIYQKLINIGLDIEPIDEQYKTEESIIPGCQNKVWISGTKDSNGNINYVYDSESSIVRGILYLLISVVNGRQPQQIIDCDFHFIYDIRYIIQQKAWYEFTKLFYCLLCLKIFQANLC